MKKPAKPKTPEKSPEMVKCPGCNLELPENNTAAQVRHMEECHPELIEERLQKVDRLDYCTSD